MECNANPSLLYRFNRKCALSYLNSFLFDRLLLLFRRALGIRSLKRLEPVFVTQKIIITIGRFLLVEALLVKLTKTKAQSGVTLLRSQRALSTQIKRTLRILLMQGILVDAHQFAIARMAL
jgi:hypothetical protein